VQAIAQGGSLPADTILTGFGGHGETSFHRVLEIGVGPLHPVRTIWCVCHAQKGVRVVVDVELGLIEQGFGLPGSEELAFESASCVACCLDHTVGCRAGDSPSVLQVVGDGVQVISHGSGGLDVEHPPQALAGSTRVALAWSYHRFTAPTGGLRGPLGPQWGEEEEPPAAGSGTGAARVAG
jgi:hypothetical protein